MGKMQRRKGAAGEREVFKIINDELGIGVKRNLEQYQKTDADLHLYGFCIEIKRQEQLSIGSWWNQVVDAALRSNECPALIYRRSRQPWRVIIPMFHLWSGLFSSANAWEYDLEWSATILLEPAFTAILRDAITEEEVKRMINKSHNH